MPHVLQCFMYVTGPLANYIFNDISKQFTRYSKRSFAKFGPFFTEYTHSNKKFTRPAYTSTDDNAKTIWKTHFMDWTYIEKKDKERYPRLDAKKLGTLIFSIFYMAMSNLGISLYRGG